jgi:RNA polymerase sigma-70 factor (ECF subfamily)
MSRKAPDRFEDVVLPHLDLVYRVAFKLTGDAHSADDLTQDAMLSAFRAFELFEAREYGARPWLLKILYNRFYNRIGRGVREPTIAADMSLGDAADDAPTILEPIETVEAVDWEMFDEELKTAVLSLPPSYRSILLLWALGDLSYREIAHIMGCAIGTVMSRIHRARKMLSETLAGYSTQQGWDRRTGKPE